MTLNEYIHKVATWCINNGISIIPIGKDKVPAIKWKENREKPLDHWDYPGCNIAILTNEHNQLTVVDCDSVESYTWWLKNRPPTPLRVRSKRGMHFWYKHPGTYVKNDAHIQPEGSSITYDVRGDGGYVLLPPSMTNEWQYQFCVTQGNIPGTFMHPSSLPSFDPAWRPDRVATGGLGCKPTTDIRAYLAKAYAIEGQGGDRETFRLCHKVRESGATESEAMALMAEWNLNNSQPPWSMEELHRKVVAAYASQTATSY